MPIRRALLVLFFAAALPACAPAQNPAPGKWADTITTELESANTSGDVARLRATKALIERVLVAYPEDGLIRHYLGYTLYREGSTVAVSGGESLPLFQRAVTALEKSLAKHPLPETHILLASLYGRLIAADPSRAMELGMMAQAENNAAITSGPNNPRVWLVKGMNAIYTPPEYGGGLPAAKENLNKAIDLFAKDNPKPGEPRWGRAEAYAWLGQVYQKEGNTAQAAAAYKKALEITPGYGWVIGLQRTLNAK
jgi:tetratricopeptide (TPR) repeat protein